MASAVLERDETRPRPPVGGSLLYLLLNLPLGIAAFVFVVTFTSVGLGTVIIWAGLPVLALLFLGSRAAARGERARVHGMLRTYVASPYRPLPATGQRARWRARLLDPASWRDLGYLVLLFPLGIAEFTIMVTAWSSGLALAGLPFYYRYLPDGAYFFPGYDERWIVVDSPVKALPWAALGLFVLALAFVLTRALGSAHARIARFILGPGPFAKRLAEADEATPAAVHSVA
ncbi:two-component system sensor kinase [Amycolatopsis acidicola]|uniref:Two-component system sensor kinase n=1 Tax=Amycolatopsis acidicola TaxID=2596893 RepID=A0A5N0VLI1_9PSEU|nr:sensor domain-containing protein [Amycolatopsis acidicola]KAA9165481.1 two-component system sensor kinase [Amycolatopsis acidicola]